MYVRRQKGLIFRQNELVYQKVAMSTEECSCQCDLSFQLFNFGVMNLSLQIFYFFFCRLFSEVWKKYNHRIHTPTTVERLPSVAHVVLDVFYTYCWYWLLVVCFKFLSLLNAKRDLRILTGNTHCLLSLSTEKLRSFYRFPWLEFLCLIVRNPAVFHFGVTSCNGHGKQSVSNWK